MARMIYLAVFSNGSRPAHWAIWIPTAGLPGQTKGKLLHVTGNTATGFHLEFKRNYNLESTNSRYQIFDFAQVHDQFVTDTPGTSVMTDTTARDRLESTALGVTPPGRSQNPFDPSARNCQHWIYDFVESLIAAGYLSDDARRVLQNAPTRI
ncbi:hypothetical protein K491DRAFT_680795 [Lophiostoma macrostomum CBS 122681]|uniref:Uncharacterized protein n=1 Tax=Lophiostoma macrostomum CBS 122681 TaxID=1314788 RepID=A0A6A6T055_9PLEO|nr:hypothetical protein K491DRAFT_680795 [Lophiostoma macrostomum CBS 122681]